MAMTFVTVFFSTPVMVVWGSSATVIHLWFSSIASSLRQLGKATGIECACVDLLVTVVQRSCKQKAKRHQAEEKEEAEGKKGEQK